MSEQLQIDPATTDERAVYRLLIGSVVPRPIGWASTVSATGVANLAPFSFFTVVCVSPPMISLTIMRKGDGSEKHTLKNARASGAFCFNVVTRPVWQEMVEFRQRLSRGQLRIRRNRPDTDPGRQGQRAAGQGGADPFRVQA